MIVEKTKNLEITDLTNNSSSILADISVKAKGHLFRILTKNFYSNPIGSLVREIASNAWDANVDNNSKKAIIISLIEDKDYIDENERFYISFKDFGKGMSPDFIRNVYFQFGESTKGNDNNQIGGFGLGKGSILAYSDIAYITTISENIKYDYILSLGEEVPQLDLINEEECLDDTGTEVKVYIKDINDFNTFHSECVQQLYYFENVYFKSNVFTFDNDYKIFNYKTFKYRTNYSEVKKQLSLILGKVQYPIDFNLLKIFPIEMNVSIYFDIGEIQPTPNRENIIYTEQTKNLIKNKLEEFKKEVIELHSKEIKELDSFVEYSKFWNQTPFFIINYENEKYQINIDKNFTKGKYQYTYKYFKNIEFYDNLTNNKIEAFYKNLYCIEHSYGTSTKYKSFNSRFNSTSDVVDRKVYINKNKIFNINFEKLYALEKFRNSIIIKEEHFTKQLFKNIFSEFSYRISAFQSDNNNYSQKFRNSEGVYFKLGEHKKLYTLIKQIKKELEKHFITLEPLTTDEQQQIKNYFKKRKI